MKVSERDILVAVLALGGIKGYQPTVRELSDAVGLKSASSMLFRLRSMRDKGLVEYEDGNARTLVVTEKGMRRCLVIV